MKILVTGSEGFVGKNLVAALENIRDGKDHVHILKGLKNPADLEVITCGRHYPEEALEDACRDCSFVFHFAGVNRPKNAFEFMKENYGFTKKLLDTLKKQHNKCPIMLASSIQASLVGKYEVSEYGRSKQKSEELLFSYAKSEDVRVCVYRFPNLFGKWCKPNYNSVIATFCYNIARNLPVQVNDRDTELELLYIDELVDAMIDAFNGDEYRCEYDGLAVNTIKEGHFCYVPLTYRKTLGEIVDLLEIFQKYPRSIVMPEMSCNSFEKRLYATYLSYLPPEKMKFSLKMNIDERGSFTELIRTKNCGQFSVNISKPKITKGQHWHYTKWELFIVVAGHGLIQERQIGTDDQGNPYPVIEFEVHGDQMEAIYMLPGYAHKIINLSDTEDLITIMWANEQFESKRPDTFFEPV